MITVSFQFNTVAEAAEFLAKQSALAVAIDAPVLLQAVMAEVVAEATEAPKRTRKSRVEVAPKIVTPPPAPAVVEAATPVAVEAPAPAASAAQDQSKAIADALQAGLTAGKGADMITLLQNFGVSRGRDLKVEQHAAFLVEVAKAISA